MQALVENIEKAFAKVKPPMPDKIACDCTRPNCEGAIMKLAFQHQSWNGIPLEKLEKFRQCLPLFTKEGFHYFYPAYLLAALEAPDSELWQYVLFSIPTSASELELFTDEQLMAIIAFTEHAREIDEFQKDDLTEKLLISKNFLDLRRETGRRKGKRKKKDLSHFKN